MQKKNIGKIVLRAYASRKGMVPFVSEEMYRVQDEIQCAVKNYNKRVTDPAQEIFVVCHDKLQGFHCGNLQLAPISEDDPSVVPMTALRAMMTSSQSDLENMAPAFKVYKSAINLNAASNIIFVLKGWETDLATAGIVDPAAAQVIQGFRNVIQSNMCVEIREDGGSNIVRGRRLIVFISATDDMIPVFPELRWNHIPLPEDSQFDVAIDRVFTRDNAITDQDIRIKLRKACQGFTYQAAEDALALAAVRSSTHSPASEDFYVAMEEEKAVFVENIPGMTYVPRSQISDTAMLPGYEDAKTFVESSTLISPEKAEYHRIKPLRGITLVGPPGTGKTVFGKIVAKLLNRILLIWNLGETQGMYVGQTEAQARRAIDLAQALQATILIDDIDKAGIDTGGGGGGASEGDRAFRRMINSLLTHMSSPDNKAVFIFTLNRLRNVPAELIRPGRMDERFFVAMPDATTRANIAKVHIAYRRFPDLPEEQLKMFAADETTKDFTGAEIESLIENAIKYALLRDSETIHFDWLMEQARQMTPQARQKVYKKDIEEMREQASQFRTIGRVEEDFVIDVDTVRADRGD